MSRVILFFALSFSPFRFSELIESGITITGLRFVLCWHKSALVKRYGYKMTATKLEKERASKEAKMEQVRKEREERAKEKEVAILKQTCALRQLWSMYFLNGVIITSSKTSGARLASSYCMPQ